MSHKIEGAPYFNETFPLYANDFDNAPRIKDNAVDQACLLSIAGQTSEDAYSRKASREEILAIAYKREAVNRMKIITAMNKLQREIPGYLARGKVDHNDQLARKTLKLVTHLISPYTDSQYDKERRRHTSLAYETGEMIHTAFPTGSTVAGGSLSDNSPSNLWHPWYSDIDISLLRREESIQYDIPEIQGYYKKFHPHPQFPWIYINYGGKAGIGGLKRDPHEQMFAIDGLQHLVFREIEYLGNYLGSGLTHLAGDPHITAAYTASVNQVFQTNGQMLRPK